MVGILSCKNDDDSAQDSALIGTWKLTENLLDPGDGSGVFEPVQSEKTITFHQDGTVTSNGLLCSISETTDQSSSGTYSSQTGIIKSSDCGTENEEYQFERNGNVVIITFLCIEPCKSKYVKM